MTESSNFVALASELVRRERAFRSLIDFARFMDPHYEAYAVHKLIASKLEDIEAGRIRRLLIFVPPASGKSRLCSEFFPAWCMGRNPRTEFIEASYTFDLAQGFGRKVRNLMLDQRFQLVFPNVGIASDARAMDEWGTPQGGEYKAEGVGGGLIGFHAHIAVIDDPFKNYEEAFSFDRRESVWNWYTSVLLNRLRSYANGPGSIVLIMQRWHDDDLGGRLLKLNESGEEFWEVVSLPSFAEENDLLGRVLGEPLLPEGPNRRSAEELNAIRARNPRLFMALHQQKPIADAGDIFNTNWLRLYKSEDLPDNLVMYGFSDLAFSNNKGDYTVHMLVGVDKAKHIWILSVWRQRVEIEISLQVLLDTVKNAQNYLLKGNKTFVRKWFFEKIGFQKIVEPLLRRMMREQGVLFTTEATSVMGLGGKDSPDRAGAVAGAMQMGIVHIPTDASWLGEVLFELSRFPNGVHDDIVDCFSLMGINLQQLRGPFEREKVQDLVLSANGAELTFDWVKHRISRKRLGMSLQREAPMVPVPPKSVLDDSEAVILSN